MDPSAIRLPEGEREQVSTERLAEGERDQVPTHAKRDRRRSEIVATIPGWYSPVLHFAFPSFIAISVMIAALSRVHELRLLDLAAIPATLFVAFGFEWRAHRYVLHEKAPFLGLLYRRHELMHHVIYTYDDMQMRSARETWLILMPAYAVLLVFLLVVPFAALIGYVLGTNVALLVVATAMLFFLSYEWLHLAYHMPIDSLVGQNRVIRILREVHRRHHDPRLMKRWNFNVTFPLFDWLLGTLWRPGTRARLGPFPASLNAGSGTQARRGKV